MSDLRRAVLAVTVVAGCARAGSEAPAVVDAPDTTGDDAMRPIDAKVTTPMDAPAESSCTSAATCATAMSLGTVSGDTGNDSVHASGYQSAWYVVRATENDNSPFAVPMLLFTELTSPSSSMYDVFVYVNTGSDVIDCTTPVGTVMTSGTSESVDIEWGETGTFANGVDDSRSVSIEVRPKSTNCSAAQPWQLVVTGDE